MPSSKTSSDKKASRRLSLTRRASSESTKSSSAARTSPLPSPRHGLDVVVSSPTAAATAQANMSDHSSRQRADRSSPMPESPSTVLNNAFASPLSQPSPRTVDGATYQDDVVGTTNSGREAAKMTTEASPGLTDSQTQLNLYRERLARDLERREMATRGILANQAEKARVSPIQEESLTSPPNATSSGPVTTTSTESGNTIRGGYTPGFIASTPSYPFPRMATTPGFYPGYMQRPFNNTSPSASNFMSHAMSLENFAAQDKVLSGSSTPASALTFHPSGAAKFPEGGDFPTPNLYDLSLMLSAEPGLDAWWSTVVQIMRDVYKAERVTLAVPADTTDIENVPWGQKATYNEHEEDELSLAYLARGSSLVPSSTDDIIGESPAQDDFKRLRLPTRPGIQSRHSFTAYEDNRENKPNADDPTPSKRPSFPSRSKSYFPPGQAPVDLRDGNKATLNQTSLARHDAQDEKVPDWEAPLSAQPLGKGRILPMLQALDFEADPLIDHAGVTRVLDRGKVIALTRSYPYLQNQPPDTATKPKEETKAAQETAKKRPKKVRGDSSAKLSALLGSVSGTRSRDKGSLASERPKPSSMISRLEQEQPPRPPTPQYEEYEQAPPSPWSQSPAPSPAVRPDPKENPFFTDATVDEDSFNPGSAPADYAAMQPPEAIGVDNSWTVLHIPLTHLLLSKPTHPFKLDAAALEQKSAQKQRNEGQGPPAETRFGSPSPEGGPRRDKAHPIAILSILSPMIPYPSNLRHSLEHLGPHLATSFSVARHYSNLETELAGLQRRRPHTAGFGAIATDGRPLADMGGVASFNYMPADDAAAQQSLAGSLTSPSDYSALSKSAAGSPSGTPGWDQGSLSMIMDKRQGVSPALMSSSSDSYFSTKQNLSHSGETSSASGSLKTRGSSKEASPVDKRQSRLSGTAETEGQGERADDGSSVPLQRRVSSKELDVLDKGRGTEPKTPDLSQHRHTQLHSYGADFATSFQSLPPSASVTAKPPQYNVPSRTGSLQAGPVDMPPPSDRLKGLMLDALPAHVFVSLPQTGEVVWVNSRYLTYRGQTVADLSADPWGSIHPEDRDEYLKAWSHSLRTGEQFSRTVRIRRFDGAYRWFYARAVASRDKRGVLMQFLGSYMDIHDQHIAELKAARQEEIEASEAKHRLLANLIPQIIFTATEDEGITFANDQWLSYTGQSFQDCLGLGFMDFVHPEDLAKCRIPTDRPPTPLMKGPFDKIPTKDSAPAAAVSPTKISKGQSNEANIRGVHQALSRNNSSSSSSVYEMPTADLSELARKGIIKVGTDSNGRLSYTTEVRLRSKSGEYRWHLIRCVEIDNIDFGSGASSFFGSATDINDHKLLEAKLKEAMESKSRFLSNMSHEIRTPLIGISGMVSFLQDTILNEEQRDYTNTIQTSANSLLMIINDILDLSKVDAGMMKLKYEWFHTRALIEDVNELVSTMAIAKRLELNYVVEADVPIWVKGDKVRIRQVLLNVIGNAIKFTTEGEVFSRCRIFAGDTSALEENEIMLEFAIVDTGRGFTKEEADLIFKPFSQIDGSSTRQHGGSGLGLVISRQLVELHGGKMEGTAVPGEGSTFTFTAKFTLPTNDDHPDLPISPQTRPPAVETPHDTTFPPPGYKPLPPSKPLRMTPQTSPGVEAGTSSLASSGSSDPSLHSTRSQITDRSSVSSVNVGLVHFSEAARASGQDLSQMKLELPPSETSSSSTPTHDSTKTLTMSPQQDLRPPMYSILIICPQTHSREATAQHIEQTLPKDVPHQITALESVEKADSLIGGDDPVHFTHIVLNLASPEALMAMMDRVERFVKRDKTVVLILSDTGQRQAVMKLAADSNQEALLSEERVTFINKPVKPSRFAVIFDPEKMLDSSIDRNRSTAQRMVESQKQSYQEIEKRMGNKGYKVLLVEDNPVNQKVLQKYLKKVGVQVEIAADGVECTDMVLSRGHEYYSLILCDLHMPRKDGYQACREIRKWEHENSLRKLPIIALSANVMSDVQDKCVSAGFSDYVTKPVDFIDLSRAMSKFF